MREHGLLARGRTPDTSSRSAGTSRHSRGPSRHFPADPVVDQFLHSIGASFFFNTTAPTVATAKEKDSGSVNFAGGNPCGTWSRPVP